MILIDADKLKQHYSWWGNDEKRKLFDDIVDVQPTIESRPKGKWEEEYPHTDGTGGYRCSTCGEYFCFVSVMNKNFCPNCGADMRGEE